MDESEGSVLKRATYSEVVRYLKSAVSLYFYLGDGCPMMQNYQMSDFLKKDEVNIQEIFSLAKVTKYDFLISIMVAAGEKKDNESINEDDDAIDKLLCERERELIDEREANYYQQQDLSCCQRKVYLFILSLITISSYHFYHIVRSMIIEVKLSKDGNLISEEME